MTESRSRHVYEADVVRVLTFACVIAVHTISHTQSDTNVAANGFEMLLHFTREAFFALTGFVLLHQSLRQPLPATKFWRRRLVAVGVPYVAWSVIYTGIQMTAGVTSFTGELHHLGENLLYGTAWYHLYFLLVTMQIYLLFPLIAALVRRTRKWHGLLLAISAAIQLLILTVQMYDPPRHGWLLNIRTHQDALIISYQFYVLLGAVAAFHLDELRTFATTHRRTLLAVIGFTAVATVAWYLLATRNGLKAANAAAVLQPVMLAWSVAATAGLFLLGSYYAERRQAGDRVDRALTVASDRSFGVFLVHPAVLWLLLQGQSRWLRGLHGAPLTVLAYVAVVAGSLAMTEVFRRSALSLPLTGRRRLVTAPTTAQAPPRKDPHHVDARHNSVPAVSHLQAADNGNHHDDRHRTADALLQ